MTVAGRRLRDSPGPDHAPRGDGLDLRWSSDYLYIVTAHPDTKPYLWPLVGQAWDQGVRENGAGKVNPFWRDDPDPATPNPAPLGDPPMPDALSIIPPKVRAAIYVVLIAASAILTPLIAADLVPSVWGTVVQSLLGAFGVFSGTMALANVTRKSDQAVVVEAYDAKHDET